MTRFESRCTTAWGTVWGPAAFRALAACAAAAVGLAACPAPAAQIINISGTVTGDTGGANTGPLIRPVQVTLGPGVYTLSDAWSPRSGLAPGALYEAWRFNGSEWGWHYRVFYDDGHDGATIGPQNFARYLLADIHAAAASYSESVAAADGAATAPLQFTLRARTTLDFVTPDYGLSDNAGGISLVLSSAAPEPSTWAMMVLGFGALGGLLRRRARRMAAGEGDAHNRTDRGRRRRHGAPRTDRHTQHPPFPRSRSTPDRSMGLGAGYGARVGNESDGSGGDFSEADVSRAAVPAAEPSILAAALRVIQQTSRRSSPTRRRTRRIPVGPRMCNKRVSLP